jgi:hypothetical protein
MWRFAVYSSFGAAFLHENERFGEELQILPGLPISVWVECASIGVSLVVFISTS